MTPQDSTDGSFDGIRDVYETTVEAQMSGKADGDHYTVNVEFGPTGRIIIDEVYKGEAALDLQLESQHGDEFGMLAALDSEDCEKLGQMLLTAAETARQQEDRR